MQIVEKVVNFHESEGFAIIEVEAKKSMPMKQSLAWIRSWIRVLSQRHDMDTHRGVALYVLFWFLYNGRWKHLILFYRKNVYKLP
ncbi:hypothetical protein C4A77_24210 [Brevibacillus laterosporus]|uniref:Uncharacterized protein n=1 Tax=Brevibacillus laterosporus TaxID=1465 RepID=A0AAP8QA15_BRELA|nr:hypothetical protein C4A77_24210 [Brevibacillus laterosporus]